jgi:sugar lactone lactonase YvrE
MIKLNFLLTILNCSVALGLPPDIRPMSRGISNVDTSNSPIKIAQFAVGTWVENIAIRSNGKFLVTMTTPPEVWEIDPKSPGLNSSRLIHHFDGVQRATGITEVERDVFMVVAGSSIWRIDLRKQDEDCVSEAINVTASRLLNGMATLDASTGTVLVADSQLGLIWRVNTKTTEYEVVLEDDTMAPSDELGFSLGINGVRIWRDFVYYNNCPRRLLCRVRIDRTTGRAVGPYEIISQGVLSDDFAVAQDGTAYLAGLNDNVVTHVRLNGSREVVAGNLNSTDMAGATSAAFGRTTGYRSVLYVTTSGGSTAPVNGSFVEGGKVMAIQL